MPRTKSIKIRLTDEEHQQLLDRCGDLALAEWLRTLGLGQDVVVKRRRRRYTPADPKLIHQLAKLGNNVNQIARVVNSHKHSIDKVWLLSALNSVREILQGLREDYTNDSDLS